MSKDYAAQRASLLKDLDGLRYDVDPMRRIGTLWLDRPPLNVVSYRGRSQINAIIEAFGQDPDVRVVVIRGKNGVYTSGGDVKAFPDIELDGMSDLAWNIASPQRCSKPVICVMEKYAMGVGLELAMACDIRIASERAQFGSFELRRGMHPADGGIVRLVNTCGVGIALEMELTGEPINAQRALAANMVSKVVPHEELMPAVEDMVAKILRNDRRAVESAKETIFEVIGRTLDEQLKVECLFGYALCGANPELVRRSEEFLAKQDKGRTGVNATPL